MRRRLGPLLIGAGAALLAGLFIGLGVWQLERRAWKHALIDQVAQRVHAAPAAPPPRADWPAITARDAYRRLILEGQFLRDRDTLVRATTEHGSGYWVMTPLQTADGVILVNRGFVPPGRHDVSGPEGPVRIVGLLRVSEPGGGFLRANDPAEDRWYSRDVQAIAAHDGLTGVAPFFVDAEQATGLPIAGLTVIRFADNHLVYALTWFGLALLAGWGGAIVLRDRRGAADG